MFVVYALYNKRCEKIYIGQTEDLERRIKLHNEHALTGYTSRYSGIWQLIYSEAVPTREVALMREKQLKSFRVREFVRKHIPR